jgi:hypothetical protein
MCSDLVGEAGGEAAGVPHPTRPVSGSGGLSRASLANSNFECHRGWAWPRAQTNYHLDTFNRKRNNL